MSQEKFSLKWNEFEKNILSTFKDLREEKELFDITLVSDEEYQVRKIYSDFSNNYRPKKLQIHSYYSLLLV